MIYDCIIIGAGAAGLFCSAAFPKKVNGLILEKTKRPGTKLLMSGSGQCNVTHSGSIKDFTAKYGKNGSKIRSCLYQYNNLDLMEFLHSNGVNTVTREDGKVFPRSMDAHEILDMLLTQTKKNGFDLRFNSSAAAMEKTPENNWKIHIETGESFTGRNVIIAAGGCSYPSTGSDGSIFPILRRDLNLKIEKLKPALSPVNVKNYPYSELSGISFRDVQLVIWHEGKKAAEAIGDLLLTHENFSGPLIINQSKYISQNDKITLNYIYPCDKSTALERINKSTQKTSQSLQNILLKEFQLPKHFISTVLADTGGKTKAVAARLTEDAFSVEYVTGFHRAMATTGGISLTELNAKTMELKSHPGLFAIGEVTDIDGETGGYNLQFAYSSARAAGAAAAERLNDKGVKESR